MSQPRHDAIEALLRQQFDGPIADEGFSDRVMQRLPPRRRRFVWVTAMGAAVGALLCWLSLAQAPLLRRAWHDWQGGKWSTSAAVLLVTLAGLTVLAACWCVSEADTDADAS